ncbi:MAG: PIN domain-containing protein [Deltaproteobacteria bacterium]|nr:PIN domain-containing protein [Deltaproteobacteria bacterium]
MSRMVLDAGAFIAFERGDVLLRARLEAARRMGMDVVTSAPVVAQVWRGGSRQVLIARLLAATNVNAPDEAAARRAGALLARTGSTDVVDALLSGLVKDGDTLITSDPDDLRQLLETAGTRALLLTT